MKNPFPTEDVLRILPVLVLLGTGTVVLVLDLFLRSWNSPGAGESGDRKKWLLYVFSLAGAAIACGFALSDGFGAGSGGPGATVEAFDGALRIDGFFHAISGIILLGTLLTIATTGGYLRRAGMEHGEFYALLFYAAGGMLLLAGANNLILVFLALETFSLAVYVLAAYLRDAQRSVEGALKYFVLGGVSSGFLLLGLAFVFGASGEIRLDVIAAKIATGQGVDTSLLLAGLALSLVGFGFKVGAFPFHSWIPDAYEGAPSLVTGFMSVTVKAAAFAVLVRFALDLTNRTEMEDPWIYLTESVRWLAIATMVFGNLVALVQSSVKRMLAYSAISHTGYLLIGVVAALKSGAHGEAPIIFYLLPYTLMTFGAFAVLAGLHRETGEEETFDSFRGFSQRRPLLAFGLLIFMVSLAGIPPTAGFWGKFYLFRQAVLVDEWALALVGILTSVLSVYYYLRLVVVMYMQPADEPLTPRPLGWGATLATTAAAAGILWIGILPGHFLDSIQNLLRGSP